MMPSHVQYRLPTKSHDYKYRRRTAAVGESLQKSAPSGALQVSDYASSGSEVHTRFTGSRVHHTNPGRRNPEDGILNQGVAVQLRSLANSVRRGLDHRHDSGAEGIGQSTPDGDNGCQIGVSLRCAVNGGRLDASRVLGDACNCRAAVSYSAGHGFESRPWYLRLVVFQGITAMASRRPT
jgi:hypothetical protein